MHRLYDLLYKSRTFLFFLFLELVCFLLIVQHNSYQNASFFNSSNTVAGSIFSVTSGVSSYFSLKEANKLLADENDKLKEELLALKEGKEHNYLNQLRESFLDQFDYIPAKVINNSIHSTENYLTLNVGSNEGIQPGMGVLSTNGIVGQVVSVSGNYATVMSLLHTDCKVSSQIETTKTLGTITWNGRNFKTAKMMYVPRHIQLKEKETIVTSGYNSVFPEGITIGTISTFSTPDHESFHDITIQLTTDFSNLYYVYVAKGNRIEERKKLERERIN